MSRNKKIISHQYPEICSALSGTGFSFVADGEIVAFDGDDISFSRLKRRMHVTAPTKSLIESVPVYYYLFDILYLDSYDTRKLNQLARKKLLEHAFNFSGPLNFHGPLRYTEHFIKDGTALYNEACKKGWEGIIAKDANAPYIGRRSDRWLKFKCIKQQEFIICGFTEPQGSRNGFGALLLAYQSEGRLIYAGKVGTGYSEELLGAMGDLLKSIEIRKAPFDVADSDIDTRTVHWVEPILSCEVSFSEWTDSGRLRHPSFIRLKSRFSQN